MLPESGDRNMGGSLDKIPIKRYHSAAHAAHRASPDGGSMIGGELD
jgi:hypothetical protein